MKFHPYIVQFLKPIHANYAVHTITTLPIYVYEVAQLAKIAFSVNYSKRGRRNCDSDTLLSNNGLNAHKVDKTKIQGKTFYVNFCKSRR